MKRQRTTHLAYQQVLDRKRLALLPTLKRLTQKEFYLAGGTALALQLQHRRSEDFDFYTMKEFDPQRLYQEVSVRVQQPQMVRIADGTLIMRVNGVECSAFRYPYPLLRPLVANQYLRVASLEDIAAMKLAAIIQRGARRDYFDLYVLLQRFTLKQLLALARKKYQGFNEYVALQALVYFEDAERDPEEQRSRLFAQTTWDEVKRVLEQQVKAFVGGRP